MVYYAMAYRFFHPWQAASALNGRESENRRERERERMGEGWGGLWLGCEGRGGGGSESSTLCSTKSDSVTGFTGCCAGTTGLHG